ncbi:MAG: hypothetical protein AAB250_09485, partial [Bdellovibrionota bacterium]
MVRLTRYFLAILFIAFHGPVATAAETAMPISFEEFKALSAELAPKVNLFQDVWKLDPKAEFFGGTSRDYLYWLKGRFRGASSRADADAVIANLRRERVIDVRSFILHESDVNVVAEGRVAIDGSRYGIKKIDAIDSKRLDPATAEGRDELKQGYIPAEKIRLGRAGLKTASGFGDGAREIYESKPTIHFASDADFWSTKFAKLGLNHPVLLALRYIRLLGVDHFQNFGEAVPDEAALLSRIDPASARAVKSTIDRALGDERVGIFLKAEKFRSWMNQAIQKGFRSYTNPTAVMTLYRHFGADTLATTFSGLEPINQYLFSHLYDPTEIERNVQKYSVDPSRLYETVEAHFPERKIYHGTRSEQAFRSIVFQGILPSEGGTAGAGLYGVPIKDLAFAVTWGGDMNRVVVLELKENAKIVDIDRGYGRELFEKFVPTGRDKESEFARAFGIDVLKYSYSVNAYVVKNGAVLKSVNGYTRKLMPFSELLREVSRHEGSYSLRNALQMISDNHLSETEAGILAQEASMKQAVSELRSIPIAAMLKHRSVAPFIESSLVISVVREQGVSAANWTIEDLKDSAKLMQFAEVITKIGGTVQKIYENEVEQNVDRLMKPLTLEELRRLANDAFMKSQLLVFYATLNEMYRRGGTDDNATRVRIDVSNHLVTYALGRNGDILVKLFMLISAVGPHDRILEHAVGTRPNLLRASDVRGWALHELK